MFSRLIGRGEARLVVATLTLAEIECHHPTSALCVIVNIPKSGASDFLLTYLYILSQYQSHLLSYLLVY